MIPARGDLFWAALELPDGRSINHRVAVVSRDAINRRMKIVVADVTSNSRERALPTAVEVESEESRLPEVSYVLCHELSTLRRDQLDAAPFGRLSPMELWHVERALEIVIGVRELPD